MLKINQYIKKHFYYVALATLIFVNSAYSKVIIWDLGDTLLEIDQLAMAGQIGMGDLFFHSLFSWSSPIEIKDQVFKILNQIKKPTNRPHHPTYNEQQLPELICNWLEGSKDSQQISKEVNQFIDDPKNSKFFSSDRHKRIIKNSIEAMFNSKELAKNMKPIKSNIKLLEKCAKKNHKLFILSNFDTKTFNCLKKSRRFKKVFQYFKPENIVISSDIGLLKPDPKIYDHIIKKYNLDPKECTFIDDQKDNLKAAEKAGIKTIFYKGTKQLEKELKSQKLI